jgi:hypothetical protein
MAWPGAVPQSNAIAASLLDLFAALEAEERRKRGGLSPPPSPASGTGAGAGAGSAHQAAEPALPAQRSVVNPNPLREALSALPGELFQVGERGCWGRA